jgi:hypothetical protein
MGSRNYTALVIRGTLGAMVALYCAKNLIEDCFPDKSKQVVPETAQNNAPETRVEEAYYQGLAKGYAMATEPHAPQR